MPKQLAIYEVGNDILKTRSEEVMNHLDKGLQVLIDDMLFTVEAKDGVGLAAPQIGQAKRVIVVASKPNKRYPSAPSMPPEAMINPVIISASAEQESDWEGCLSVPGVRAQVQRAKSITLQYTNRQGKNITREFSGFPARIIQHEIDHLDGVLFTERVDQETLVNEQTYQNALR